VNERRLRRALLAATPPDEIGAQRRSWRVTRTAFAEREPTPWPIRRQRPIALAAIGVALLAAALSPPGRAVLSGVRDAVGTEKVVGIPQARPAPFTPPTRGRVLVAAPSGVWTLAAGGARRKLGDYDEATWSPQGRFVGASNQHQLSALTPKGVVRWTISQPRIRHPRWSPSGFRVAYVSRSSIRVVAGDGTGDRRLDGAEDVAPAWKPGDEHVLAYVAKGGNVNVVNTDSGAVLWTGGVATTAAEHIEWSPSGQRLVAAPRYGSRFGLTVFDSFGRRRQFLLFPGRLLDMAISPEGRQIALIRRVGPRSELLIVDVDSLRKSEVVFSGKGLFSDIAWSPDGGWLLLGWASADQWLFIRSTNVSKISAVSSLRVQFDPGGAGAGDFPRIEGWCCPTQG
jgi:WD40-like Beta Propeller Repeat